MLTGAKADCTRAAERVGVTPDGTVTLSVNVPFGFHSSPDGVAVVPMMPVIPVAELQIHLLKLGAGPSGGAVEMASYVREIGITSKVWSAVLALVFLVGAFGLLFVFAKSLQFKNDGRWLPSKLALHAISQSNGWASLSQFQIMLWTLLIATGAVYVVTLTGSLLVLTSGTLVLLGIAGAAVVGTQFQAGNSAANADSLAPGPVLQLAVVGSVAADGALLSWAPVPGSTTRYTVQRSEDGVKTWATEATLAEPRFRLVGAAPNTRLRVKVFATNSMGPGHEATVDFATSAQIQPPQGAPGAVADVSASADTGKRLRVRWAGAPTATGYHLEYRRHESDRSWHRAGQAPQAANEAVIEAPEPGALYDVRIVAFNAGGESPPSRIQQVVSGERVPRWSDLVTESTNPRQIDVTRLQMLLFTAISALFVALKIADSGMIPEIPSSYVTLMGISNGVYLTAKFVGR